MSAPTVSIVVTGPKGTEPDLIASALVDLLLTLGATSVAQAGASGEWRGRVHHVLASVNVQVTASEGK
jgi:hypothetical protein